MSYKVKKRKGGGWSLRLYDKGRESYVTQDAWPTGLNSNLSVEQARELVRSLNVAAELSRTKTITKRTSKEEKACAWLPDDVVSHFERIYVEPKKTRAGYGKLVSSWKLCRKLIVELNLDPSDWSLEPLPIHDWFRANPRSLDYCRRVLRLLNRYGHLYCRKRGTSFLPVEALPEDVCVAILEDFEGQKKSAALRLEDLRNLRDKLTQAEYLWVSVSFWFGLRPEEVNPIHWKLESVEDASGAAAEVFCCYQPKLRRVPKAERWKRIPVFTKEQNAVYTALLANAELKRPSVRKVRSCFPEGVTLYGCRHGFTRHMEELGQPMDKVSKWLGHRSIKTTEKYYRDHGLLAKAA